MRKKLLCVLFGFLTCGLISRAAAARTIEFETTEVTLADVTLSPDGQWLIFTMLGHLFRLPVTGGTAEQLTFGPYYDTDPVFSPDGSCVVFVSDRDGSDGNVFLLELTGGRITQVTHESWVRGPTWTPDGQAIAYLRVYREEERFPVANLVRRVALQGEPSSKSLGLKPSGRAVSGGEPETISALPRPIYSVFYLPDGRLAWTVTEPEQGSLPATTRIEVVSPEGTVSTLRRLEGATYGRVVASPTGDGLYWRRWESYLEEHLVFSPLPEGAERFVVALARPRWWRPGFAVADDNKSLYVGDAGRLWKIALPSGAREHIPFRARVKLDIQDLLPPPIEFRISKGTKSAMPTANRMRECRTREASVIGAASGGAGGGTL